MRKAMLACLSLALALVAPILAVAQVEPTKGSQVPRLSFETRRSDTSITLSQVGSAVLVDIKCPSGIDRGTLTRTEAHWPEEIRVRLHLSGLESFSVGNGLMEMNWFVSNSAEHRTTQSVKTKDGTTTLKSGDPQWSQVMVKQSSEKGSAAVDYLDIVLPKALVATNPESLSLAWVDFYR
ncbi:MAG: hypothetical protein AB7S74_02690 [Hyphomicrobium sp.]